MFNDITQEQMDLVNDVHTNHLEEFKLWGQEHGKPHIEKWVENGGHTFNFFNARFAYYMVEKFIEWKRSDVEDV